MAIPNITPYSGGVANPDGSQTQTEFTQNMFDQLSYEAQLASELNATVNATNATASEVAGNAAIAQNASDAAQAAANFEGDFTVGVTSAVKGKSYSYNGNVWLCLQNTTTTPSTGNAAWKISVGERYVTEAQEDLLPLGSSLFKGDDGVTVKNGDNVPAGTTHLRVLVSGKPTIVAMSPIVSGVVSLLTEVGATIGVTPVEFSKEITVPTVSFFSSLFVPLGFTVKTQGYYTPGDGADCEYLSVSGATADGYGTFATSNGLTLIPTSKPLRVEFFGTKGVTGYDDAPHINAFLDYSANNWDFDCEFTGEFYIQNPLLLDGDTDQVINSKRMKGSPTINVEAVMEVAFTISSHAYSSWNGIVEIIAGGLSWSDRKAMIGVAMSRSGRSRYDGFYFDGFKIAGLTWNSATVGNTSAVTVDRIRTRYCGSGSGYNSTYAQTTNWTKVSDNGTSGSAAQTTTLTVSENFISKLEEIRTHPFMDIDGEAYYIESYDHGLGTIDIYPWLNQNSGVSGTGYYVYGGGVVAKGSDSNVHGIGLLDAFGCATAYDQSALYGPRIDRLLSQGNYFGGAVIGERKDSASVTFTVGAFYTEGDKYPLFKLTQAASDGGFSVYAEYAFNPDTDILVLTARLSNNDLLPNIGTGLHMSVMKGGKLLEYRKSPRNRDEGSSAVQVDVGYDDTPTVYRHNNSWNIRLTKPKFNNFDGKDSSQITIIGDGANGKPSDTAVFSFLSFDAVPVNVNGVSTFDIVGPYNDAPLIITVYYDYGDDEYRVYYNN